MSCLNILNSHSVPVNGKFTARKEELLPYERTLLAMKYDFGDFGTVIADERKGDMHLQYKHGDVVHILKSRSSGWTFGILVGISEDGLFQVKNNEHTEVAFDLQLSLDEFQYHETTQLHFDFHPFDGEALPQVDRYVINPVEEKILKLCCDFNDKQRSDVSRHLKLYRQYIVARRLLDLIPDRDLVAKLKVEAEQLMETDFDYDPVQASNVPHNALDLDDLFRFRLNLNL